MERRPQQEPHERIHHVVEQPESVAIGAHRRRTLRAIARRLGQVETRMDPPRRRWVPGRPLHGRLIPRRGALLRAGGITALLAVVGPGLLAGLSDDDPAGITT